MNNITDLRFADFPTMVLLLAGDIVVHITAPSLDLLEELNHSKTSLEAILRDEKNGSRKQKAVYDLAAKLINCNDSEFTTTGFELLTRYRWGRRATLKFFEDYQAFIESLENEKN